MNAHFFTMLNDNYLVSEPSERSAQLVKTRYIGLCTSEKCCRQSNSSGTFKLIVDKRAHMPSLCSDCGSALFWTKK